MALTKRTSSERAHRLLARARAYLRAGRSGEDGRLIAASGLFDASHYLAQLGASADGVAGALDHFLLLGNELRADPHPLFDIGYYLQTNPDVGAAGMNALVHYLRHGWREGRNPHPAFDTDYVLEQLGRHERNPLVVYCERVGRGLDPNPLFDTSSYVAEVGDDALGGETPLGHLLSTAYRLDHDGQAGFFPPGTAAEAAVAPASGPLCALDAGARSELARTLLRATQGRAFPTVVLLSAMRRGGAEREAMNIIGCLIRQHPVLLVSTDHVAHQALDWLPRSDNLTHVTFEEAAPRSTHAQRVATLARLLLALAPRRVINCNSHVGWTAYERHGPQLAQTTALEAMLFCHDRDANMLACGYASRYLGGCLASLAAVYVDNQRFIDELAAGLALDGRDKDRLKLLYHPAAAFAPDTGGQSGAKGRTASASSAHAGARPRILWAGRPCPQKRVDLLVRIAEWMPEADFLCAGGRAEEFLAHAHALALPANMTCLGDFRDFHADLPLAASDALLHTAAWEGLPNVLIDALAAGLPVVATDVGGVGELVTNETGWLVPLQGGVEAFVAALRCAIENPAEVEAKGRRARALMRARHSREAFATRLAELGLLPAADARGP